jgi:hypothetical protein
MGTGFHNKLCTPRRRVFQCRSIRSPAKSAHSAETPRLRRGRSDPPAVFGLSQLATANGPISAPEERFFAFSFVAFFRSLCSVVPYGQHLLSFCRELWSQELEGTARL